MTWHVSIWLLTFSAQLLSDSSFLAPVLGLMCSEPCICLSANNQVLHVKDGVYMYACTNYRIYQAYICMLVQTTVFIRRIYVCLYKLPYLSGVYLYACTNYRIYQAYICMLVQTTVFIICIWTDRPKTRISVKPMDAPRTCNSRNRKHYPR